ncbi:MAG: hypothetical protein ACR2HF_01025 [Methylococcaceae bacterium]
MMPTLLVFTQTTIGYNSPMTTTQQPDSNPEKTRQQWHRLLGLMLEDRFYGSPYRVAVEVDVARKTQLLDIVVVEQETDQAWSEDDDLPDGFENLKAYNLITFKSHHESLNNWAVKELIGHYVNYRKQISTQKKLIPQHKNKLMPQHAFGLYAVCNRYPQKLKKFLCSGPAQGIYELTWGTDSIRVIVLSQISQEPKNDLWQLFSHKRLQVELACSRYRPHRQEQGTAVIRRIVETYQLEFPDMAYTFDQFTKEFVADHLKLLSPDEVLKHYSPDQRLNGLSPDQRLKDLSPDQRLKDLSPDEIADHLSPESLERLLARLEQRKKS